MQHTLEARALQQLDSMSLPLQQFLPALRILVGAHRIRRCSLGLRFRFRVRLLVPRESINETSRQVHDVLQDDNNNFVSRTPPTSQSSTRPLGNTLGSLLPELLSHNFFELPREAM